MKPPLRGAQRPSEKGLKPGARASARRKGRPRQEPVQVGGGLRPVAVVQAEDAAQVERIADRDVGNGKTPGDQVVAVLKKRVQAAQPGQEPLRVVLSHGALLRRRLEGRVAQVDGLREGQRRVRLLQPVQVVAVLPVRGLEAQTIVGIAVDQVLADGDRLGHRSVAIGEIRHRAQRVQLEEVLVEEPRRERQHLEVVGQAELFQGPERTQGAGATAMPELHRHRPSYNPYWRAARSRMISSEPPPMALTRTSR